MDKFNNLTEEKKDIIIDAALVSFGTNGYKKASINDIATAAGISKAMVFHYFGTKKALYLYLINYCADLIMNEISANFDNTVTDFFERIMQASTIKISAIKRHPASIAFLNSMYFEQDKEVRDDIKELLEQSESFRNKIALDGMDTSKFRDGIDPNLVLKMLVWMAEGFVSNFKLSTNDNLDTFCEEYYKCMDLLKRNFYKED